MISDLLILGLILFSLVTAFIMPWVVFFKQNALEEKLRLSLKNKIDTGEKTPEISDYVKPKSAMPWSLDTLDTPIDTHILETENPRTDNVTKTNPQVITLPKERMSIEEQFGKNLPVWGGGIALALSAFFFVKYSIDNNLFSPIVRVLLGGIFGISLLYTAQFVRQKEDFVNGKRIAQSLAGAGIIVLYIVIFAASKLYDLIPVLLAFVGMAFVTATALVMSLRHGMPIAVMALIGGFLTPVFLGGNGHNTAFLFGYLYVMIVGLHYIIKKTQWWWLSIFATISGLLWVCATLFWYSYHDGLWLGLFLMGLCCINIATSKQIFSQNIQDTFTLKDILKPTALLNYISLTSSVILMGVVVNVSGFGILEWGLFGLLALATIGLAYFNDRLYGFAPWVSFVTLFILFLKLSPNTPEVYFLTMFFFASIYTLSSCVCLFGSRIPVLWACLAGINSIAFYVLGFFKTHATDILVHIPLAWGFLALCLGSGAIYMITKIKENDFEFHNKQYLYAIFSITATAFITLGLYIELPYEFLSVAIATQMVAIAWINQRISIKALEKIIAILAIIFGLILFPQFLLMIQLTIYSLTEAQWHLQASLPLVTYPLFQLGIPAFMFLATCYLLRSTAHNVILVKIFESVAIGLIAIMGYYLTRNILNPDKNVLFVKAGFFERGIITNVLFLYGLLCFFIGRIYNRTTFSWGGIILVGAGLFRIMYFDVFLYNPLWASQQIKGLLLLNSLILPYGLPIIWTSFAQKELTSFQKQNWKWYLDMFKLLLLFVFLNLNIRHFFHPEFLNQGFTSNVEIYTYSVLWLFIGGGLLYAGALKQDKMLRFSSLGIIVLAVGKVFLYDASELQGLYRVFSFLGLGISLIFLSYFYARFILNTKSSTK